MLDDLFPDELRGGVLEASAGGNDEGVAAGQLVALDADGGTRPGVQDEGDVDGEANQDAVLEAQEEAAEEGHYQRDQIAL